MVLAISTGAAIMTPQAKSVKKYVLRLQGRKRPGLDRMRLEMGHSRDNPAFAVANDFGVAA
jgi:hypothetical protein